MSAPLKHHERENLCTTRARYRQGRHLTSVKVYTINQESKYLLLQGVPIVATMADILKMCNKLGAVEKWSALDDYPREEFTKVIMVKYKDIRHARIAKRKLDDSSFYGGVLHVCFAPEQENVSDTREKLQQRRIDVARQIRKLASEAQQSDTKFNTNEAKKQSEEKYTSVSPDSENVLTNKEPDPPDQSESQLQLLPPPPPPPLPHSTAGPSTSKHTTAVPPPSSYHPNHNSKFSTEYSNQNNAADRFVHIRGRGGAHLHNRPPHLHNRPPHLHNGPPHPHNNPHYRPPPQHRPRGPVHPAASASQWHMNNYSRPTVPQYPSQIPESQLDMRNTANTDNKNSTQSNTDSTTLSDQVKGGNMLDNADIGHKHGTNIVASPNGNEGGKGWIIIKKIENQVETKQSKPAFVPRQTNRRTVLPAELLASVTHSIQGTDPGAVNSIRRAVKRKVDPVNEELRQQAFVLSQKKAGPQSLPEKERAAFEDREAAVANPSLDASVYKIRQQVMQFSAKALPPQLKRPKLKKKKA